MGYVSLVPLAATFGLEWASEREHQQAGVREEREVGSLLNSF